MCGDWETETSSGIFQVGKSDEREDKGDAVDYAKETSFDCHYHDCDEYWILYEGSGVAATRRWVESTGVKGQFTFQATGFRNHNDAWTLRPSAARKTLRQWLRRVAALSCGECKVA